MAETPSNAPEIHIATPTTGNDRAGTVEYTTVPSSTAMHDFTKEEIALIDSRLQALANVAGTDALKRRGEQRAIIAKDTNALIQSLRQARGKDEKLSKEEIDQTITADHFEKADTDETLIPPPIPETVKPEEALKQTTELLKNPPKKSSDFYKAVAKIPIIGPLITSIIDSMRGGYSFEAEENFEAQVVPMLGALGIELPSDGSKKRALGKSTMEKLGALGVPLENTQAFFQFITDPTIDIKTIPQNLRNIFESGRKNYDDVLGSLNPDPLLAMQQILGFTVEKTGTTPADAPVAPTEPTTPEAPKETEITIGDLKLSGTPEDIQSYKGLQDTAKKILGAKFDEKEIIKLPSIKDAKPEDRLRALSTTVFVRIVDKMKLVYGPDFASKIEGVDKVTKDLLTNYMDDTTPLDEKSVKTMGEILSDKNMEKIFWAGVKKIEEYVANWKTKKKTENSDKPTLIEKYNKIGEAVLFATTGYRMTPSDAKHEIVTGLASKIGYAGLVEKNMSQFGQFSYLLESANEALADKTLQIIEAIPKS